MAEAGQDVPGPLGEIADARGQTLRMQCEPVDVPAGADAFRDGALGEHVQRVAGLIPALKAAASAGTPAVLPVQPDRVA